VEDIIMLSRLSIIWMKIKFIEIKISLWKLQAKVTVISNWIFYLVSHRKCGLNGIGVLNTGVVGSGNEIFKFIC
jgi:hypothetical protein